MLSKIWYQILKEQETSSKYIFTELGRISQSGKRQCLYNLAIN